MIFKGASPIRDFPHLWEVAETIPRGYWGGGVTVLLVLQLPVYCCQIGVSEIYKQVFTALRVLTLFIQYSAADHPMQICKQFDTLKAGTEPSTDKLFHSPFFCISSCPGHISNQMATLSYMGSLKATKSTCTSFLGYCNKTHNLTISHYLRNRYIISPPPPRYMAS